MSRADRFVAVIRTLLRHADDRLERASQDRVAANELQEIVDQIGILIDDHVRPVKPYAEMLIPQSKMIEHDFQEVDS